MKAIYGFYLLTLFIFCSSCELTTPVKNKNVKKDYSAVVVSLEIEGEIALLIMLHEDGTINRKGRGTEEIDKNFFMGMQKDSVFHKLMNHIDPALNAQLGKTIKMPNQKGKRYDISIVFESGNINEIMLGTGKAAMGVHCTYGSQSEGPPMSISNFVKKAIELTDPWYNEQVKMVEENLDN